MDVDTWARTYYRGLVVDGKVSEEDAVVMVREGIAKMLREVLTHARDMQMAERLFASAVPAADIEALLDEVEEEET